jgi:hypothetical protein
MDCSNRPDRLISAMSLGHLACTVAAYTRNKLCANQMLSAQVAKWLAHSLFFVATCTVSAAVPPWGRTSKRVVATSLGNRPRGMLLPRRLCSTSWHTSKLHNQAGPDCPGVAQTQQHSPGVMALKPARPGMAHIRLILPTRPDFYIGPRNFGGSGCSDLPATWAQKMCCCTDKAPGQGHCLNELNQI